MAFNVHHFFIDIYIYAMFHYTLTNQCTRCGSGRMDNSILISPFWFYQRGKINYMLAFNNEQTYKLFLFFLQTKYIFIHAVYNNWVISNTAAFKQVCELIFKIASFVTCSLQLIFSVFSFKNWMHLKASKMQYNKYK